MTRRGLVAPDPVLVPGTHSVLGENLLLCHDRDSGLSAAISVDDTALGPGLGGVRWMTYPSFDVATEEACRLSRVMTLKNALADIPFGGAKSVIMRHDADDAVGDPRQRTAQLLAFAGFINRLGGAYVPGVDMGTSVADSGHHRPVTPWASCAHEDPSPATADGVFSAIEAAVHHSLCRPLTGVRVVVQGAGHVGAALARRLANAGALVAVADIDTDRAADVAAAGRRHDGEVRRGPRPTLRRLRPLRLGPCPQPTFDCRVAVHPGGRRSQRCAGRPGKRRVAGRAGHHLRARLPLERRRRHPHPCRTGPMGPRASWPPPWPGSGGGRPSSSKRPTTTTSCPWWWPKRWPRTGWATCVSIPD